MKKIIIKNNQQLDIQELYDINLSLENEDNKQNSIEKTINTMFNQIDKLDKNIFNKAMNEIKNISSEDDLYKIVRDFINIYEKASDDKELKECKIYSINRINQIKKELSKKPKKTTAIIINKLIEKYYYNILSDLPLDQIQELLKIKKEDLKRFLQINNYKNINNNNLQKNIEEMLIASIYSSIYNVFLKKATHHKCWDCTSANAAICPKVEDYQKRIITAYPFIDEGFQIINNKKIDRFIVNKCNRFTKEKKLKK